MFLFLENLLHAEFAQYAAVLTHAHPYLTIQHFVNNLSYSSSALLVQGTFGTPSALFIMYSFSDIKSGLLFMPKLDAVMFKDVFYKINGNI
jgi:hypothetical protein